MADDFFERHQERRALFGDEVDAYDLGRPGYPYRTYELLGERCGLGPGARVLEIGPGTGQATRRLLDAGASVTAVELSRALADRLRSNLGDRDLDITIGSFEEVELPTGAFDLVVAATAFHWVPADTGIRRCADLLRVGGSLALWWNYFGDHSRSDPFHEALLPVLGRLAPELLDISDTGGPTAPPPFALDVDARTRQIEASGRFGPVYYETISWTGRHSPEQLRALFGSYSPWLALSPQRRRVVLDAVEKLAVDDFGGTVERPYLTPIYVASKRGDPA